MPELAQTVKNNAGPANYERVRFHSPTAVSSRPSFPICTRTVARRCRPLFPAEHLMALQAANIAIVGLRSKQTFAIPNASHR
jgi:hypothetical protein